VCSSDLAGSARVIKTVLVPTAASLTFAILILAHREHVKVMGTM
jgi:hypothetical protein